MEHALAQLFGLPDWAPKVVQRVPGVVLAATFLLTPNAFREGMDIWMNHETAQLMRPIQPMLDDMMTPNPVAK